MSTPTETAKPAEPQASDTATAQADTSHSNSTTSLSPTNGSKQHWQQPKTVRQFASQVNAVATRVLNGEIDMEIARNYAALTRVLSQAISVEVTRARFLKKEPNLMIDEL